MSDITLAITCCGRVDLLKKTVESINKHPKLIFTKKIIIDDSGNRKVGDQITELFSDEFEIILNEENKGQIYSIDKMYSLIQTEYIFHCEEDWNFYNGDFLEDSIKLLRAYPEITVIALRDWEKDIKINCNMLKGEQLYLDDEHIGYKLIRKGNHNWSGFTFNPGLRRLSDYKKLESYKNIGQEEDISIYYLERSKNIAILKSGSVEHIGWDDHVYSIHNPYDSFLAQRLPKPITRFYQKTKKIVKRILKI